MKTSSSSNHLAMLDSLRSPGSPTAPAVRERTDSVGSNREDVTSTSRVGAAFTTFACSISGGLLTLPAVFAHAALAPAMILCSLAGVSCIFSLLALIMCADLNPRLRNYGHLLGWFGGVKMEKAMLGIIGLFLTGALGGTFIIVHDYMVEVFGTGLYGTVPRHWPPPSSRSSRCRKMLGNWYTRAPAVSWVFAFLSLLCSNMQRMS